ncbi:AAA family ATPase [Bradyrhizobium sp. Pa8]|uniref:AAA family ATPase n=1 Tax=Bradyrhizobium sp. Pa8 TaxID=3386552 RepID=UPI00403F108D
MSSRDFSKIGTVVVFGVSGVGKTVACSDFIGRHPEVMHTSAGALLQSVTATAGEVLRTESPEALLKTQMILGEAFANWQAKHGANAVLVDAHSVIDNDRALIEIPVEVIRSLKPSVLVLLEEAPEVIVERRRLDSRSRPLRSIEDLHRQIETARRVCRGYAEDLDLPFEVGALSQYGNLDELIVRALSKSGRLHSL